MIAIRDKSECCGCEACFNACPVKCITMKSDEEGFLYPHIDARACIDCKKCESICPVINTKTIANELQEGYAAVNTKLTDRLISSSGGIFIAIASRILDEGGVVVGCAFSEDCKKANHIIIKEKQQLKKLLGSKYLQSNIQNIYADVKFQLKSCKKVLFSGTPCQVAGLKSFLNKQYNNLICIDLICHGVPSPLLWSDNIEYIENKKSVKITNVNFRSKKYGGASSYGVLYQGDTKILYRSKKQDPYFQFFLRNLSLRPSCYACAFKGISRNSDITLGDFWGINDYAPHLEDGNGVSIVIIHSKAGKSVFEELAPGLDVEKVDITQVFNNHNKSMCESVQIPKNRTDFWLDYQTLTFDKLCKKYAPVPLKENIKMFLKKIYLIGQNHN